MKECKLNENGFCICYLKKCNIIKDCAPKLIVKRNMDTVKNLINGNMDMD